MGRGAGQRWAVRRSLAQSLVVGLPGVEARPEDLELVGHHGLGGVILFRRNVESPLQVWEMNYSLARAAREAENPPLFSLVDQEGGAVARLMEPFTHGPDLAALGGEPPERLWEHGARMGRELVAAGFNWNLAPVLDVHARPDGVMARRSLGGDPDLVGRLGAAFIQGSQQAGCLACAKHFPGLGRTTLDTHRDRPTVELTREELEAVELPPFRAALAAGVAGVMVCHAVFRHLDPEQPASLSPVVMGGLLRGELGYQGLILTDDLEMGAVTAGLTPDEAAVRAYVAGADLLLICHSADLALTALDRLTDMVMQGELDAGEVWQRQERIKAVKSGLPGLPPDSSLLAQVLA
ncbi:MAG: beta-N-acetylhexosaminidase [Deltaproteobacteria bacterium]|nr:beta-N-acetylhexosaminidase [Deltaproteobacteria bacterium]